MSPGMEAENGLGILNLEKSTRKTKWEEKKERKRKEESWQRERGRAKEGKVKKKFF